MPTSYFIWKVIDDGNDKGKVGIIKVPTSEDYCENKMTQHV